MTEMRQRSLVTSRPRGTAQTALAPPVQPHEALDETQLDWQENQLRPVGQIRRLNTLLWGAYLAAATALAGGIWMGYVWLLHH